MATFYCSECNFSKPVKDEMAGKKARCPKCNAVNVVPKLGEEPASQPITETGEPEAEVAPPAAPTSPAVDATETTEATEVSQESAPKAAPAPAPEPASRATASGSAGLPKLPIGWLMAFGGAMLPIAAGALLLCISFEMITLAVICFGIGMLAFCGLAAYYSFT